MSKLVSTRLEDELAEWVESYRATRGWSRAELIDAALRAFREDTRSGVPGLPGRPLPPDARREAEEKARAEMQAAHLARQQRLNEAKYGRKAA